MTPELRIFCSMATQDLLADLAARTDSQGAPTARIETVDGIELAGRVQAGEAMDIVVLAADTVDRLIASGRLLAGSRTDLARSGVAVAVKAGAPRPDIGSEAAVREAVLAARTIGYSTGPSGVHLRQLFTQWGIAERIADRVVPAPPGVPVGRLIADGRVELGFQQLGELIHIDGIAVLGTLPDAIQRITTFAAGACATTTQAEAVRAWLAFAASPALDDLKIANGMEPVSA